MPLEAMNSRKIGALLVMDEQGLGGSGDLLTERDVLQRVIGQMLRPEPATPVSEVNVAAMNRCASRPHTDPDRGEAQIAEGPPDQARCRYAMASRETSWS